MKTLIVLACLFTQSTWAKTITDYYLDSPKGVLEWINDDTGAVVNRDEKLKIIKVRDDKNGYLKLESEAVLGISSVTLALFNTEHKASPLIVISTTGESASQLEFYQIEGKNWKNVQAQVFPESRDYKKLLPWFQKAFPQDSNFKNSNYLESSATTPISYELPKVGTTIVATCNLSSPGYFGKKLFKLNFNGAKFKIESF